LAEILFFEASFNLMLITAVAAPEPYNVLEAPFKISIDST